MLIVIDSEFAGSEAVHVVAYLRSNAFSTTNPVTEFAVICPLLQVTFEAIDKYRGLVFAVDSLTLLTLSEAFL